MFTEVLPSQTAKVLQQIQNKLFLNPFYLTGGTALALQIGHRESEDLDFFTQDAFDPLHLQKELEVLGHLESIEIAQGTLNLFINQVKFQFLHYPYHLINPLLQWNGITLSSDLDIACTKLLTISMRGSKKDFIDLFFLLKKYSLRDLFATLPKKYIGADYNHTHIMKSLLFFKDAQQQPMPRMHKDVSWNEVKDEIVRIVKDF